MSLCVSPFHNLETRPLINVTVFAAFHVSFIYFSLTCVPISTSLKLFSTQNITVPPPPPPPPLPPRPCSLVRHLHSAAFICFGQAFQFASKFASQSVSRRGVFYSLATRILNWQRLLNAAIKLNGLNF